MKVSFKLGAINLSAKISGHKEVLPTSRLITAEKTEQKEPFRVVCHPARDIDLTVEASEYSFECEAGELPAIYKELAPLFSNIVAVMADLKKLQILSDKPKA